MNTEVKAPPKGPTRLFTAEHAFSIYHHTVAEGVTVDDLLNPGYWAHVAPQLRPGYRVICDATDLSWTATFMVRAVNRVEVFMAVISHTEFKSTVKLDLPKNSPYSVKFRGPKSKWSVIRRDGNTDAILKEGFDLEELAVGWLNEHVAKTTEKA